MNCQKWYDESVFYHIYPLGLTGAPKQNEYNEPVHRLRSLLPWTSHLKKLGMTGLYIGPLFESVGHGYETTDYRKVDSRLGTNEDLRDFVCACHQAGIRVILDGVFNHTGRDFFAFRDLKENRENSPYREWYCNVNFWGNNEYGDGFSYDNWGGYNLLVKLNQRNPAVRDYLCDVIRFWVHEFDIDGLRLDAADVLDFEFMKALRRTANEVKEDFWLMGEVIHGDYSRWANADTLHSVTNYALHKALYSGHNDHNYFEIAHTVQRTNSLVPASVHLYNFADNHDVERICTKLNNKAHYLPVHILLYALPGIPSVYYGSEFGIEGRKEWGSDDSLRPCIDLQEHMHDDQTNTCTRLIVRLGIIYSLYKELAWGDYRELFLTTGQFAFARGSLVAAVNNADQETDLCVAASGSEYIGLISGQRVQIQDGSMTLHLNPNAGDIFAPADERYQLYLEHLDGKEIPRQGLPQTRTSTTDAGAGDTVDPEDHAADTTDHAADSGAEDDRLHTVPIPDIPYEQMSVEQLQAVILAKMEKNGNVTDRMRRDVTENIWHDSLENWAKSF